MLQPWKHFQRAMTWMVSQAAWVWAKTGILEPDEAYSYVSDDESAVHEDYHENEEKPPAEPKDEKSYFDQTVLINRTRLEVCDQEVNLNLKIYYTYIITIKITDYNYIFIRYNFTEN